MQFFLNDKFVTKLTFFKNIFKGTTSTLRTSVKNKKNNNKQGGPFIQITTFHSHFITSFSSRQSSHHLITPLFYIAFAFFKHSQKQILFSS